MRISQHRRTAKKHNAEAEIAFTYDSNGKLLMQSNGISFLYDHAGIAGMTYDGNTYLYRKNAQGDVIALFGTNGAVVATYTYDAWGNCEVCPTAVIDNNRKSEYNKTVANLNPIRYRSYYFDTETGFYWLQSRFYDPATGRFVSQDEYSYLDPDSVNGINLFAYCNNNPVMLTDSTGNGWWKDLWNKVKDFFSNPVVQIIATAVVVVGLGIATAVTGGAAGVVLGAAFAGAMSGVVSGAVIGAITGTVTGIATGDWSGMFGSITGGMLSGAIIGGVTGALLAGINIATGAVKIAGSAQKTGTFFHRMASNVQAGKMATQIGRYSQISLDKSLNKSGLIGRCRPDVTGLARYGNNLLVEVTSKSQTYMQMETKLLRMIAVNPNTSYKVISWAARIAKWFS